MTGMSDGRLLERFITSPGPAGEAAFGALVRRHGPLVLGVCRGVLRDDHDADDAFQATFLVLARRAATVRDRDRLAAWLGRTARRIALRARKARADRRAVDGPSVDSRVQDGESPAAALVTFETAALVRAVVDRLPESDRLLMRLTYWQGKSYEEAADATSRPIGTVRSRLARARERLRERLARHGLASPALAIRPSDALIARTVRAGAQYAVANKATVPAAVAALVEGEFTMTMTTTFFWKSITAAALIGGTMTAGAVSLARRPPEPAPSAVPEPSSPPEEKAEARPMLANGGVEEGEKDAPRGWSRGAEIPGVEYIWDRDAAHGGKASLCLKKTADRYFPIAQWSQKTDREGGAPRLKVSAWIKAEKAGKAILDAQFLDGDGKWSHAWVSYIGAREPDDPPVTHDWKRYEGVVAIPPGTKQILVAPQIYGPGTVWFDDLRAGYTSDPATDPLTR
jgi:RNA polymerase sigma-70 factor (ECF subfamily)